MDEVMAIFRDVGGNGRRIAMLYLDTESIGKREFPIFFRNRRDVLMIWKQIRGKIEEGRGPFLYCSKAGHKQITP
jgi:hypothetical protein